jgi:two-component system, NtrC family, response regulator HydG
MAEKQRPKQVMSRLLIVDDDNDLAQLLAEVLTHENCVVDTARNGMEALEQMRAADYDAVICDLLMLHMDGEELHREVAREFPYLADRFVFITGQAERHGRSSDFVMRSGNTLLIKPFEIEELRVALKDVLSR